LQTLVEIEFGSYQVLSIQVFPSGQEYSQSMRLTRLGYEQIQQTNNLPLQGDSCVARSGTLAIAIRFTTLTLAELSRPIAPQAQRGHKRRRESWLLNHERCFNVPAKCRQSR
jgi:hypothetical protein